MTPVRDATREDLIERGLPERETEFGVVAVNGSGGAAATRESFDSDCLGVEIARVLDAWGGQPVEDLVRIYEELVRAARSRGYDQVLRRVPVERREEVWALETNGFELMDVLVTFAYHFQGYLPGPELPPGISIAPSTDADISRIVAAIDPGVWASRYEADVAYSSAQVAYLRREWVKNSHAGRAAVMLVAAVDDGVAGYVVGLLEGDHGAIDLIETFPQFQRRGVGSLLLACAMSWFSTRASVLTVATQATNYPAARLYEEVGFRLGASHLTYRRRLADAEVVQRVCAGSSKGSA